MTGSPFDPEPPKSPNTLLGLVLSTFNTILFAGLAVGAGVLDLGLFFTSIPALIGVAYAFDVWRQYKRL